MITTLRITNVEEAKTAVLMIEAYLSAFPDSKSASKPKPEAPAKKTAKKPPVKTENKPESKKETKPESEVVKEEKAPESDSGDISLADMTALAKATVARVDRDSVKDLIASFGTGKLSSVNVEKYGELKEALETL